LSSLVDDEPSDAADEIRQRLIAISNRLGLEEADVADGVTVDDDPFEPLVSVVVPVYNNASFVLAAIDSVRRQSYTNWECIVVDDASSDGSGALVEADVTGDRRFRLIRRFENGGPAKARNMAIGTAAGEYLAFLDGDDLLLSESLALRVAAMGSFRSDPFVVGSYCGVDQCGPKARIEDFDPHKTAKLRPFIDFVVSDATCPFTVLSPLVDRRRVQALGGFDETMLSGAADWELWYRVLRNGYLFKPAPFVGALYRQHAGGFTRTNPARHTAVSAGLIRAAYKSIESSELHDPTEYPMLESLTTYLEVLRVAERAVRFASMALADGDRSAVRDTLSVVETGYEPLLARHLDMQTLVAAGVARSFGVAQSDVIRETAALDPFVSELRRALIGSIS
jgi:glycosyltransferase involved in cell wall biosynthesis